MMGRSRNRMKYSILFIMTFSCFALLEAFPVKMVKDEELNSSKNGLPVKEVATIEGEEYDQHTRLYNHEDLKLDMNKDLLPGEVVNSDTVDDKLEVETIAVLKKFIEKRSIRDDIDPGDNVDSGRLVYTFEGDIIAPVNEIEKKFEMTEKDKKELEASSGGNSRGVNKQDVHFKEGAKWRDNTVPYFISSAFTDRDKELIIRAMQQWENTTCLRFVRRSSESDYIYFNKHKSYCNSHVGRQGGPQIINAPDWCLKQDSGVEHEIGHALGLWHEQSRPDRDSYIIINVSNVDADFTYNFDKQKDKYIDFQGSEYDYASIMHYPLTAFSKTGCRGQSCITMDIKNNRVYAQQGGPNVGHQSQLSPRDIKQIQRLYNCPGAGKRGSLWIHIKQGLNVTDLETGGTHDPFLNLSAVDSQGREYYLSSSYRNNTRYPIWNEWMTFPNNEWQLLRLRVCDHRTNTPMTMSETIPLLERPTKCINCQHCANIACNILVTYYYEIVVEHKLTVYVRFGINLTNTGEPHGYGDHFYDISDPYIEVRAYNPSGTPHNLKTHVKLNQLNPVWNQALRYRTGPWKYIQVTAYDRDYFSEDEPLSSTINHRLPTHTSTTRYIRLPAFSGGYVLFDVAYT